MIDLTKAKMAFKKYVSNYDITDPNVELKIEHTYRVADVALEVSKAIGENEENQQLAELIGILHDIGRFEQLRIYHTFKDRISIDHGNLGVEILKKDNFISEFCDDPKYYDTIFKAIYNHNKFKIEEGITGEQLTQCKIIRDSDKIDILNLMRVKNLEYIYDRKDVENEQLTPGVYETIMNGAQPLRKDLKTDLDDYINMLSFIYDIYYKKSFEILKEKNYINDLIDRAETNKNQEQMESMRKVINNYIADKCK
jgi:putative nucleotidyltransferase with HDIG domain